VASKYSKFQWSYTGFDTEEQAKNALADMEVWFGRTYDAAEWTILTTVKQTAHGFQASMDATRDPNG
jgi:hypothetical protein